MLENCLEIPGGNEGKVGISGSDFEDAYFRKLLSHRLKGRFEKQSKVVDLQQFFGLAPAQATVRVHQLELKQKLRGDPRDELQFLFSDQLTLSIRRPVALYGLRIVFFLIQEILLNQAFLAGFEVFVKSDFYTPTR